MKKITLLVASIFLFGGIVANAAERYYRSPVDFRNAEPIMFTEKGIAFYVFVDGRFDFSSQPSNYDRNAVVSKKDLRNNNYGQSANYRKSNNGVDVDYDRNGKIRRIGNVHINYDSKNRISKIGSVSMDYNRYGLEQVGNLHIVYNKYRQIVDIHGEVNRDNCNQPATRNYVDDYPKNNSKTIVVVAGRDNIGRR